MRGYNLEGQRFGRLVVLRRGKTIKVERGTRVFWLCQCDCGKQKEVTTFSLTSGKTQSCGCLNTFVQSYRKRENSGNWKGGKIEAQGYIRIWKPEHPNSNKVGYINEHTLVMSTSIGRPLIKGETVHHKNGIKTDNRLENLELWSSSHSSGQRVNDKIYWCVEFLNKYASHLLNKKQVEALYPIKIEVVR